VCSVSADPPTLLVCVNKSTSAHDPLLRAGCFSVNLLSTEQTKESGVFSGAGGLKGDERFREGRWSVLETGAPVLEEAVAVFDCRISQRVDAGSHTVFFGAVVATQTHSDQHPLIYLRGDYLKPQG
jgi:flavin reductase (DIM6/NTAB) family NADH-FMN oxidoreductase RutF